MAKITPLQAAQQAIDLLRNFVQDPPNCDRYGDAAPHEDCECRTCSLARDANNIVDRYDGEDV